ncbi:hypothetical protein LY76DRAFT_399022 [Colletotrichum caudatum]|nr:hypothetical protein LY76DRAFT_399022 [Colletotrichum caudatum]
MSSSLNLMVLFTSFKAPLGFSVYGVFKSTFLNRPPTLDADRPRASHKAYSTNKFWKKFDKTQWDLMLKIAVAKKLEERQQQTEGRSKSGRCVYTGDNYDPKASRAFFYKEIDLGLKISIDIYIDMLSIISMDIIDI